jgi:hypothetical protein
MSRAKQTPSPEQLAALQAWANVYGTRWKASLHTAWEKAGQGYAAYTPQLQQLRNNFGPSWLVRYKLPQ